MVRNPKVGIVRHLSLAADLFYGKERHFNGSQRLLVYFLLFKSKTILGLTNEQQQGEGDNFIREYTNSTIILMGLTLPISSAQASN